MNSRHNIAAGAWQFWQQKDQLHRSNLPGKRSQSCGRNEGAVRRPPQPTMAAMNIDQAASCRNNSMTPTYLSTMTTDQTRVQLQEAIEEKQKELVSNSAEVVHKPERNDINVHLLPTEPVLVSTSDEDHYFDITNDAADIEEMSNRLACLAKAMLDEIENLCKTTNFRFDKKFRLEFLPRSFYNRGTGAANNSLWELRINLDPMTWFDWKWSHVSLLSHDTQREFLFLARAYVDKYKNFISEEYLDAPKQMPLAQSNKAARYGSDCHHKVAGQYRNNGVCGLSIFNETVVMKLPISKEYAICLPNYRYEIDWLIALVYVHKLRLLRGIKIVGKHSLSLIPVLGWS
ncbi:unnamed protein product [Rotaria sordida]|uniref:Uncharacterized protein n=1 Tax=Rotaria sordida TaxID=392033 RepID=A0A815LGM0_9BILA|nr:unnamed protein product [Rotaria sordida]